MPYNQLYEIYNATFDSSLPRNSIIGNGHHQLEESTTISLPSTSPPLTDEPLTSTQKLILYIFLGAVGGFILFGLLRAVVMRILHGPKGGSDPPVTVTSEVIPTVPNESQYNLELERRRMAEDRPVYNVPVRSSQRYPPLRRNNSPCDETVFIGSQMSSSSATSLPPPAYIQQPQRQQIPEEMPPPKYDKIFPGPGEKSNSTAGWMFPPTKRPES